MSRPGAARLAWCLFAVCVALLAAAALMAVVNSGHALPGELDTGAAELVAAAGFIAFPLVGALIAARRPSNPIGWLFLASGFAGLLGAAAIEYAVYALDSDPGSLPAGEAMAWLGSWAWVGAYPLLGTFPVLLFPDGHLLSRRWRPVALLSAGTLVLMAASYALEPGPLEEYPTRDNPLGVEAADWLGVATLVLPIAILLSVASVVTRLRRATGEELQQLRWFSFGAVAVGTAIVVVTAVGVVTEDYLPGPLDVAFAVLAAAIGVAILKYRLYELDLVVNRALVYAGLTACVIALYIVTVALLDAASREWTGTGVVAAGLVAVVALPLRAWLQLRVDRLMYGDRRDPYAALSRLGEGLEATSTPADVLPAVVDAVAQAVRVPYVAIELPGGEIGAQRGSPGRVPMTRLPLGYRGEAVGALVVGSRGPGEDLSGADRRLLRALARQAGVAVHGVTLTRELQRSRRQLVAAREEERRRLRRDLHDGLGPVLAAAKLQAEGARRRLPTDPDAADELLARLASEIREMIGEVRRLVYELRPPALDELGLVGALREQAAQLGHDALPIAVESPDALPPLPAAVEVAAYRIALEAMTNAARHAGARTCTVSLALDGDLEVSVRDDGGGVPDRFRPGVGLASMRERAEELGGRCTIEPGPAGGTVVRARLPVPS